MRFLATSPKNSWQPVVTANTTTSTYWLNWRFLLCAILVLISMVLAYMLISKYEGPCHSKPESRGTRKESAGLVFEDEIWKPCLRRIHPVWLLAFRIVAFLILLLMLILNVVADGGDILYFYTQWTFTLVTIYFGLGSLLSMYGVYQYHNRVGGDGMGSKEIDAEQGINGVPASCAENANKSLTEKDPGSSEEQPVRQIASFWGYVFQIIFQMNAGAVMLTDCVFWFIIVPFLTIKDYNLNFLVVNMHTANALFLFGDAALNSLRFPWFRISYFFLWTAVYVIFNWIIHACISLWWTYPFLDLSSSFAPLWYLSVAIMHIPCYGVFVLVMKLKHLLWLKWFPQSYQCAQ